MSLQPTVRYVLGTPLWVTTYADLTAWCHARAREPGVTAIDFTNTHILTMRRHDAVFREITSRFDYFVPDGMPLIWCLNRQGARMHDRVYGPTFMRECLLASPAPFTHHFLGGSQECLDRLHAFFLQRNPQLRIVGSHHGYFQRAEESRIIDEINCLSPDFLWVGLGTPKQQDWIHRNKARIHRGLLMAIGYAFDVNAGMKPDAPLWMQERSLTWLYRLWSEPRRLAGRYFRYNSLFLFYLFWDGLRGRAFRIPERTRATVGK